MTMRRLLHAAGALMVLAVGPVQAQRAAAAGDTATASLVAAEVAFAKLAADSGTRTAFLAVLDGASLMFWPGPTPGRAAWEAEGPSPAELKWYPAVAGTSAAGDLGFTSGPSEFRRAGPSDPEVRYGSYFSVWRRTPGGPWRLLLDLGPPHPKPATPEAPWTPAAGASRSGRPVPLPSSTLAGRLETQLRSADARFGAPSLASDARVLRPGVEPRTGGAARELVAGEGGAPSTTGGAGVSRSGDLGYTWGTRSRTTPQGVQDGHYVRVWRRDGVEWRAVADVVVAPPPAASGN